MELIGIEASEFYAALGAFVACMACFPLTIRASRAIGLVDTPTARKQHSGTTPLAGGITIFLTFFFVSSTLAIEWINVSMLTWIGLVLAIGVYDDIADISALNRLAAHSVIIVGIFATDGLVVYTVGDIFGTGPVTFSTPLALCLTIIAVLGAVNSVNMIDGLDGLLGCLAVVSLFTLLVIALLTPTTEYDYKSFATADIAAMLGALSAFLVINCRFFHLKQAIVFLGDAGSTTIGFCIVYLLIDFSQGTTPLISPVTAGWILGLPLLDASAVIGRRVILGKSPLRPGRDHIHHQLVDAGISVNQTVALLVLVHCLMVFVGVASKILIGQFADIFLFWTFVSLVIIKIAFADNITTLIGIVARKSFDATKDNPQTTNHV